jgi:hypothetical protein
VLLFYMNVRYTALTGIYSDVMKWFSLNISVHKRAVHSLWFLLLAACILCRMDSAWAQVKNNVLSVTYISAENIYLDGGRDSGLNIGDTLEVWRGKEKIAEIQLLYLAEHTSSSKLIQARKNPQIGDRVEPKKLSGVSSELQIPPAPLQPGNEPAARPAEPPARSTVIISGNLGVQWYQFVDRSPYHQDFSQPAVRFNFKAQNLWNRAYNLRIRLRSRYNYQPGQPGNYSTGQPQQEWRNRIYEFSFANDPLRTPVHFRLGRIISNTFSGAGYIDGALLQHNVSDLYHWGIFAGAQPEWQFSDSQTSIQKYGIFANYLKGEYGAGSRLEAALALVGAYHDLEISREYIYIQSGYGQGKYYSFFQNAEIDVNRSWRREKTGQMFELSSLLLSGNFYISDNISATIGYDRRRNYYTYEQRSLADSLFDNAFRQGVRSTIYLKPLANLRLSANVGYNRLEHTSQPTYSSALNVTYTNFAVRGSMITGRLAGFSNLYTRGLNSSMLIGKNFNRGHVVDLAYGQYRYTLEIDGSTRLSHWLRSTWQVVLPWHLFLNGQYEYDWGDDRQGHLISTELSYHF